MARSWPGHGQVMVMPWSCHGHVMVRSYFWTARISYRALICFWKTLFLFGARWSCLSNIFIPQFVFESTAMQHRAYCLSLALNIEHTSQSFQSCDIISQAICHLVCGKFTSSIELPDSRLDN